VKNNGPELVEPLPAEGAEQVEAPQVDGDTAEPRLF
jgi:hypothetical protein